MEWNQLSGPIPESLGRLPLQGLGLGHNQLSGPVPLSLGRVNFDYIDLNRNRLVGDPSHLFSNRYKSLRRIDLSRNLFDFDLSRVVFPVNLSSMDLSHNMIRGSISLDIVRVPELYYFNVSYNGLCGRGYHRVGPCKAFPASLLPTISASVGHRFLPRAKRLWVPPGHFFGCSRALPLSCVGEISKGKYKKKNQVFLTPLEI
ncbi:hypothetical protein EJ110_NYTH47120 [Nymphaea thermarum]|nr:hypothetical protein EJ110_NYTH47120 [Nymphaea thermarum]